MKTKDLNLDEYTLTPIQRLRYENTLSGIEVTKKCSRVCIASSALCACTGLLGMLIDSASWPIFSTAIFCGGMGAGVGYTTLKNAENRKDFIHTLVKSDSCVNEFWGNEKR